MHYTTETKNKKNPGQYRKIRQCTPRKYTWRHCATIVPSGYLEGISHGTVNFYVQVTHYYWSEHVQ